MNGLVEMSFSHAYKETRKYRRYHHDNKLVDEILAFFSSHDESTYKLSELSRKTNIDAKVLSKWRIEFKKDPEYRPGGRIGYHRRRFTDVQERAIAEMLRIQYVLPGIVVRRKHLRSIFFEVWKSFDLNVRGKLTKNFFSNKFVRNFCKRNNFSFRQMRKKKRSDIDEDDVARYAKEFLEVFTTYPWHLILNMDETAWNFVYANGQVLAITGKEEVDAQLPDDYRKSFTVIATISAEGGRHPPVFIAKGSTPLCERQFDGMTTNPSEYFLDHSPGNTNEDVIIRYLTHVSNWVRHFPCVLFMDQYSSHVTPRVQAKANELKIRIIYIPKSATDKLQPLDRRVFGTIKSMAKKKFAEHIFKTGKPYSKPEAADLFMECWKKMGRNVIDSAWTFKSEINDESGSESSSDEEFRPYDSDYDSEEEEAFDKIDDEEIRLLNKEAKEPNLTPPREIISIMRK
jgi:hypothetical protein